MANECVHQCVLGPIAAWNDSVISFHDGVNEEEEGHRMSRTYAFKFMH